MAVISITNETFDDVIKQHPLMLIDFWADWCAPCKQFGRTFEKVAAQYPDICFAKVNIESSPELAELFQVRSIPYLVIIKDSVAIYADSGAAPESTLKELIEQARAVDVTDVKKET